MFLTSDHLATLDELGGDIPATTPAHVISELKVTVCRALARDGLARRVQRTGYSLTAEGQEARRLVAGMLTAGLLCPREVMAPDWHFIDDDVLAAVEAAARDADRVALPDAPLLLARGLATLREEPDELRLYASLTAYGRAWLELASRLRRHADTVYRADAAMPVVPGSLGTRSQPDAASV